MNNSRLFPNNIIDNPPYILYANNPSLFIEKSINTESYTSPLIDSLIKGYLVNSIMQMENANKELDKILAGH